MRRVIKQDGFAIGALLIVLLVVSVIGGAFYMVKNNQKSQTVEESKPISRDITDSSKKEDNKYLSELTKGDIKDGYLVIPEWKIRMKVPEKLHSIYYLGPDKNTFNGSEGIDFIAKSSDYDLDFRDGEFVSHFRETRSLRDSIEGLTRTADSTIDVFDEPRSGKKIGNWNYFTSWYNGNGFGSLATGKADFGLFYNNDCVGSDIMSCDKYIESQEAGSSVEHLIRRMFDTIEDI